MQLSRTTVSAGLPITGLAIVTNRNAQPIVIETCNHQWLQVGLNSEKVSFDPVWNLCADSGGTMVRPGITRIPIRVDTSYQQCTPRAADATAEVPACEHRRDGRVSAPPLPPGTYSATAGMLQPKGVPATVTDSIKVTLTP